MDVALGKELDDGLIGVGALRIFIIDDPLDGLLHALRGDILLAPALDGAVEEKLQFEDPPRGMHIFIACDAGDGALMHIDRLSDIAKDHRLKVFDTMIEKFALLFDNAFGDARDCLTSLLDAPDKPLGGAELILNIFAGVRVIGHRSAVESADL